MNTNSSCNNGNNLNYVCNTLSYQSIQITLNNINGNTEFSVIITDVRNPPSYKPTS